MTDDENDFGMQYSSEEEIVDPVENRDPESYHFSTLSIDEVWLVYTLCVCVYSFLLHVTRALVPDPYTGMVTLGPYNFGAEPEARGGYFHCSALVASSCLAATDSYAQVWNLDS